MSEEKRAGIAEQSRDRDIGAEFREAYVRMMLDAIASYDKDIMSDRVKRLGSSR